MRFERGELLLLPFSFTDQSASKRRPVLALTAADQYGDFIGMPVTSRPRIQNALAISSGDLISGSLPAASWIRTDRPVTLSARLVQTSVARLQSSVVEQAVQQLCRHLGHE